MVLYKIVMLGDGGVGKSCLTIQLVQNQFVIDYDPTIENSYRKQVTVDDEVQMLDILDTAGQEDYSAMRDQYIRTGQGFILVYSICSRSTFQAIKGFHEKILQVKDVDSYPIVILGNKADLASQREVSTKQGEELAQSLGNVPFFETSAKTRLNIEEGFFQLIREIRSWNDKNAGHNDNSDSPIAPGRRKKDKKSLLSGCVLI